mgnify:FL=1
MSFVNTPPQISIPIKGQDTSFLVHRVFCIGRNYKKHIAEMGYQDSETPFVYFMKPPEAIVNSGSEIPIPGFTNDFQHEVELVLAIGESGSNILVDDALNYIFGYAVGIDMTCRDIQKEAKKKGKPWAMAKSIPNSAPVSDLTAVADCGHLFSGTIELSVNGTEKQKSGLENMIRTPAIIIHELSKIYNLQFGDIIFTGTPEGVGQVTAGDKIEASIDGLETLSCSFI